MKHLLFLCLLLSIYNCHNKVVLNNTNTVNQIKTDTSVNGNDASKNETLAGKWQLQPVLASDTSSGKIPELNFDLTNNRFHGNSGCNAISGSFVLKADGLTFNQQMISTKMACPGYNEKIFMDNLFKTNRYEIKQGVLHLMYNTTIISNWVRHADTTSTKQI